MRISTKQLPWVYEFLDLFFGFLSSRISVSPFGYLEFRAIRFVSFLPLLLLLAISFFCSDLPIVSWQS